MKECYGGKEKDCGQGRIVSYKINNKKKTKKNFKLDGKLNLYIMRREFEVLFSFNMYVLKLNLITS